VACAPTHDLAMLTSSLARGSPTATAWAAAAAVARQASRSVGRPLGGHQEPAVGDADGLCALQHNRGAPLPFDGRRCRVGVTDQCCVVELDSGERERREPPNRIQAAVRARGDTGMAAADQHLDEALTVTGGDQ